MKNQILSNTQINSIQYLEKAITAWHAVDELQKKFQNKGFIPLQETQPWNLEKGKAYYVTRNGRSLAAFRVGTANLPEYRIIATHTDSPHLRLKTESQIREDENKNSLVIVRTSVYGGAILNTWFDRPLAIAGSVFVQSNGALKKYLFDSEKPIGIIPNAPIHLNREVNKGYEIKPQEQLPVILEIPGSLNDFIAEKLDIQSKNIVSTELELYLPNKPILSGYNSTLLSAPRIDNQIHCILAANALCNIASEKPKKVTSVVLFFDSEETGSRTIEGAHSAFTNYLLERISLALKQSREEQLCSRPKSLILSADVAHAWNPNFSDKYDSAYKCKINEGPVIKVDVNNRYATTPETEAIIKLMAQKKDIPLQKFIIHSDLPCGSTVGPMISADSLIPCVDVGIPIWAMHSSCETAGIKDIEQMNELFEVFLQ
jgi:aspartyl aminopeptidase